MNPPRTGDSRSSTSVRLSKRQQLRRDAEQQLQALIESSPAAILTVGFCG